MKGKKALKEYRQIYVDKTLKCIVQPSEDYYLKIIEKDLDRLEKLEKENKELRKSIKSWNENAGKLFKENINLKNVTEILKDKRVDVAVLLYLIECGNNTPQYYNKGLEEQYRLTQEQYELLKEVLEDD